MAVVVVFQHGTIITVNPAPLDLPTLRSSPALPGDPRPGTRSLAASALGQLDIELVECTGTRVVARMPVAPVAGRGALLVLAETVASTAAGTAAGPAHRAFGAELNGSFAAAPTPGMAIAIAEPLVVEATRHTWNIRIFDGSDDLVMQARCTLGVVDAPQPATRGS